MSLSTGVDPMHCTYLHEEPWHKSHIIDLFRCLLNECNDANEEKSGNDDEEVISLMEHALQGFSILQWGTAERNKKKKGGKLESGEKQTSVLRQYSVVLEFESEEVAEQFLKVLFVREHDKKESSNVAAVVSGGGDAAGVHGGRARELLCLEGGEWKRSFVMAHYCMPTLTAPEMEDCRSDEGANIPGLSILRDFISPEEESRLLQCIDVELKYHRERQQLEEKDEKKRARMLRHRMVVHYGYEFNYSTRKVDPSKPISPLPEWSTNVRDHIANEGHVLSQADQLTVNEYFPGHGINPHVDTHSSFEDYICSVSLGSDIVMVFINPDTGEKRTQFVPARALMIMRDESRYLWRHGIYTRKMDKVDGALIPRERRLSLTFRKVKQPQGDSSETPPCRCQWPKYCDSQNRNSLVIPPYPTSLKPGSLEEEHVHKFYDAVANHWDSTRHSPWPTVTSFIVDQPPGSMFADIGCGNGKYINIIREHKCHYVACDRSEKLVEICASKYGYDTAVADATILPYRSNTMDAVICIAVMHHISSEARRIQLLRELTRIARPGGEVLVVSWALEQGEEERRRFEKQDVMVPWHYQKWRFDDDAGPSNDRAEEAPSPDDKKKEEVVVYQRYCHVYKRGEMEELLSHVDGVQIMSISLDRGNWTLRFKKEIAEQ